MTSALINFLNKINGYAVIFTYLKVYIYAKIMSKKCIVYSLQKKRKTSQIG